MLWRDIHKVRRRLSRTTTSAPVSLDVIKEKIGIETDITDYDDSLTLSRAAAIEAIERITGLSLYPETWRLSFACLPTSPHYSVAGTSYHLIRLDARNVSAVSAVNYINDGEGSRAYTALDSSKYFLADEDERGLVYIDDSDITVEEDPYPWNVEFTVDATTNDYLNQAICLACGYWFRHPEGLEGRSLDSQSSLMFDRLIDLAVRGL